jgi:hypothetical protein
MNRTALALTFVMALSVSIIAGMQTLEVARANFLPAPAIIIYSPAPIIYANTSLPLNVGVNVLMDDPEIVYIHYSIDGNANVTLTDLMKTGQEWFAPGTTGFTFHVHETLDLGEGNHTLKVFSQDATGKEMSSSVEFTINTQYRYPEVIILSPQNKTYTTTEVPLIWACTEQKIVADYTLDLLSHTPLYAYFTLSGNESLTGNTTLTGLSNGTHTLTVYVITERGSASQTVHFTVSLETQPQPEPFPTALLMAASGVTLAVVCIGLLVHFRKRNHARIGKHSEKEQSSP